MASKTLVTGATGLIGSRVVARLLERGDEVRAAVRSSSKLDNLVGLDYEPVRCDVLDGRTVRRAVRGVDRVFHAAGLSSLRAGSETLMKIHVLGTQTVLEECAKADVEQVVYTSSYAAIGPAPHGSTADEEQPFRGDYGIPFVTATHAAELRALRFAARGLPVVIVNPAHVFGRGDLYRSSTDIVRRFLRRQIPAYADGALNIVDVDDVARGHLLADERGKSGERYILGNRNYTLDRLFADLGRMSGVEPPALKLPLGAALAFARARGALPGGANITEVELRATALWWTYRSNKAKRELGWQPAPHEDTLEATIAWYREREGSHLDPPGSRQALPYRLGGFAARQVAGAHEFLTP